MSDKIISPTCPKCGYVMCEQFDDKPFNDFTTLAIPNGTFICYFCKLVIDPKKVTAMNSPEERLDVERRQAQRRASDRGEREDRKWALVHVSIAMYWAGYHEAVDDWTYAIAVQEAMKIVDEVELREAERAKESI